MSYPEVLKARMIRRMAGPERQSAAALATETEIPRGTLSRWLKEAGAGVRQTEASERQESKQGQDLALDQARRPRDFSVIQRAQMVVEASTLEGEERGLFLRKQGLFEENIQSWMHSLDDRRCKISRSRDAGEGRRIAELEKELRRKDKALAEAATLLVLKKKLGVLLGDDEEPSTTRRLGRRS